MYHYYLFHKPFGCVTARRDVRYPTVMDWFSALDNPDLSPVGRLDRETEGLLLITDDGMFNQALTRPEFHKEKVYEFLVLGDLTEEKRQEIMADINAEVRRRANIRGFNFILDRSGKTLNGQPALLVFPNDRDITAEVIRELNRTAAKTKQEKK